MRLTRVTKNAKNLLHFLHEDIPLASENAVTFLYEKIMACPEKAAVTTEEIEGLKQKGRVSRMAGNQQKNVLVLENVDRDRFAELFIKALERLDAVV